MKSNLTTTVLNVVLGVCLLAAIIFAWQSISLNGEWRYYNGRASQINSWKTSIQAFEQDCIEYSKKNRDIVPLLESFGLLGNKPMTPTATKPAAPK